MKLKFCVTLLLVMLFTIPAKADNVLEITGTDVHLAFSSINFSIKADETTSAILAASVIDVDSELFTLSNPSLSTLLRWTDADGSVILLGADDYVLLIYPFIEFPAVGDYSYTLTGNLGSIVSSQCGPSDIICQNNLGVGFFAATGGSVVVAGVPEPNSLSLLMAAIIVLCLGSKLWIRSGRAIVTSRA